MSGYQPGYGALSQQFNQDPFAPMQSQTAANNAVSANYESKKRLAKNCENYNDNFNINQIRHQLSNLEIVPLRNSLEITTHFPLEFLPVQAQKFVKTAALTLGVSEEIVAVCLLGAIFIAARGNFKTKIDNHWSEVLTGYIVAAAPSGDRKSAVVDLLRPVFTAFEAELRTHYDGSRRQSEFRVLCKTLTMMEQDLSKRVHKKIQKTGCSVEIAQSELRAEYAAMEQLSESLQKPNAVPRILLDSPTLEALPVELERQGEAIGILEPEGGLWKNRVRSALDDILLKGYTGESFASDTKTLGSEFLRSPVIAICSLVQPNVMQALYDDEKLAGHGVTARILPVFLPSRKGTHSSHRYDMPNDLQEWYEGLIRRLLKIRRPVPVPGESERTFHILSLSTGANARIRHYCSDINDQIRIGFFDNLPAFGAKLAGHAVRLAAAIHLMNKTEPQSEEIDEQSMQAGIALADFFRVHAEVAFTPEARDGIAYAKKIYDWMRRHRPQIFDERTAQRGVGHCSVAHIRAGLGELERQNYLKTCFIAGGKALYVVHPGAYGFFV